MSTHISEIAEKLDQAAKDASAVPQISLEKAISIEEAYRIQAESIDGRISRGEMLTGYKLGFTSRAKMEQMGLEDIIFGRLTDAMHINIGESLDLNRFIHPRVEPELAFLLKKDVEEALTLDNVKDHVSGISIAIEVIDSRYENFKFSLEDVIADNCSSSGYMIGPWLPTEVDISNVDITLVINDETVQSGNSSAILGNPWESMVEASKMALKYNAPLKRNQIILAGAATSAVYVKAGDQVEAKFGDLGILKLGVK